MDERLALGALEGADADAQALAELVDHLIRRVSEQHAQRRRDDVLVQRPEGERRPENQQPGGNRDAFVQATAPASPSG